MRTFIGEVTDQTVVAQLRDWIANTRGESRDIGLDTNLIGEGLLDSLEMVNFLLFIEELRGTEIPAALIQPENFATLRIIHNTFFAGSEPASTKGAA